MPIARRDSLFLLPFALCASALFSSPAPVHADIYHAVTAGETLSGIAAKYRVSPDHLRALNGLSEANSVALTPMLLRVPQAGGEVGAPAPKKVVEVPTFSRTASLTPRASGAAGFVARTISETVQRGDTWDAIAARYQAAGYEVSSQDLQKRNNWQPLPAPGQTVVVPLGQIAFSLPAREESAPAVAAAPRIASGVASPSSPNSASRALAPSISAWAQSPPPSTSPTSAPQRSTSSRGASSADLRPLGGGVYAAGEGNLGALRANLPVVPKKASNDASAVEAGNSEIYMKTRGSVASRGGYGQLSRMEQSGEVPVASPAQEATASPAPRTTTSVAAPRPRIARVARVKSAGAQIRRLPLSSAATLYRCGVGTQLAVLRQENSWSAVLMSDRSTGWMPSKYLALTEQSVDVSIPANIGDGPGGSAAWSVGRYRTTSPYVAQALTWLGTRYVYGGTSRRGIDCSALVMRSFAANGINLPRTAAQQARVGTSVAPAEMRAGDRLYFSASGTRIDHTGLYMGDGLFVHASGSGRSVIVSNLYTPRNWNIFVGARR